MKKSNNNKTIGYRHLTSRIKWLMMAIFAMSFSMVKAQTTVLDPNGAGGFELGTTFAANGWTEVQNGTSTNNKWYVGTAYEVGAGVRGAYISNNGGGAYAYTTTNARTQYFYRDVTFPAGQTGITLTFNWRCNGENDTGNDEWDFLRVYLVTTSTTPTAGSFLPAANIIGSIKYNLQNSTQTATITIPAANAGTTKRLVFCWRNDGSAGSQAPAGVDNIGIVACVAPVASASSDSPICTGGTLNLTSSGGTSYSWTGPNSFTSTSQNPSVTNMTAAKAGTYTVTVTNSCSSSTASTTVAVNAAPTGTATASSTSVCPGTAVTLNANQYLQTTGQNLTDFSIPDNSNTGVNSPITISGTGLTAAAAIVNVQLSITHNSDDHLDIFLKAPNGSQIELSTDNGGSGNNYTNTIFQTGGSSVTSGSAPFTGTYAPEQAFSGLTGTADGTWNLFVKDDAIFTSGSITEWFLTVKTTSGVTYVWSSTPSGFSSTAANPTATPSVNTTYEVIATGNGCTGSSSSVTVNTLAAPVASISSNTPVCENSDLSLSASGGTSYAWTGPNGFTSSQQNPLISNASLNAGGTYSVVVTNAFGCTDDDTHAVTVNDRPSLSVGSQNNVTCNGGADGVLQMSVAGGASPFLYNDGLNFNYDGLFSSLSAGDLTITVADNNGCEDVFTASITQPDPITTANAGTDQELCNSGTATVTGNTPSVGTGSWSLISGTALITNPNSVSTGLTGLGIGTIQLRYTITQVGCGSNFDDVIIENTAGLPAQPGVISGVTVACPPQNGEVLSIAAVPGATSYEWTLGPGTNGVTFTTPTNGTSVTVNFGATANSGYTIRVSAVNACGVGLYSGTFIRRTVSTPLLTGTNQACANDVKTFTVPTAVAGATQYIWTAPSGSTINGNSGPYTTTSLSVNVQFPPVFVSGNVCVKAVSACGIQTSPRCLSVTSTPARPIRVDGQNTACPGGSQSYSVPAVAGATSYNWFLPANASIISGAGTNNVTIAFAGNYTSGNVCVSATNPCTTGPQMCMNVLKATPSQPRNIVGPAGGLCGATEIFTVPFDAGTLSYNWTVPSGAVINSGAGTNTVEIDFSGVTFSNDPTQYSQISVSRTNTCSTGPARALNIKGVPSNAASISGPTSVCSEESGLSFSVPAVYGANSYNWNVPNGAIIIAGQGTSNVIVDWGTTSGVVSVTASNACGNGGTRTLPVFVGCRVAGNSNASAELLVAPNPARDLANISFKSTKNDSYTVTVSDLTGRVMMNVKGTSVEGINTHQLNLSDMSAGIYMVTVQTKEFSTQTRLIVE